MGTGQRSNPSVIVYELGPVAASRRALAVASVGAVTALAPLVLAVELFRRFAWTTPAIAFWIVTGTTGGLIVLRAVVHYRATLRRLGTLCIVVDDQGVVTRTGDEVSAIPRFQIARIVEIDGSLGGLRVESKADPGERAAALSIPRGGKDFGLVRALLERWRPIERKRKRGPLTRLLVGAAVVAGIFFLPFLMADIAARSNIVAAAFVGLTWIAVRFALRDR